MLEFESTIIISQMFRGSSYSIETDKDISFSNVCQENVRIAMVGVTDVGKSSIINCIEKQRFCEDIASTNGYQLRFKKIKINHHLLVNLTVWDGGGDRMLQFIQEGKLKNFDGIFYVYDLTDANSVIQLQQLYSEVTRHVGDQFVSIIVGNKADLAAIKEPGQQQYHIPNNNEAYYLGGKFSERHHMIHQNVSAKLNSCITDSFVLMIKEILNQKRPMGTSRIGDDEEHHIKQQKCEVNCPECWNQCNLM